MTKWLTDGTSDGESKGSLKSLVFWNNWTPRDPTPDEAGTKKKAEVDQLKVLVQIIVGYEPEVQDTTLLHRSQPLMFRTLHDSATD